MKNITIRLANIGDAANLAAFSAKVFYETFFNADSAEDIALYLEQTYGPEQQTAEINNPSVVTLLAESETSLLGYAQIRRISPPECVIGTNSLQLQRLYIDKDYHGSGLAQKIMEKVLESAKNWSADILWLGVWEHNLRAVAFYKKYGFKDIGSSAFYFGSQLDSERIMVLNIN